MNLTVYYGKWFQKLKADLKKPKSAILQLLFQHVICFFHQNNRK